VVKPTFIRKKNIIFVEFYIWNVEGSKRKDVTTFEKL